MDSLPSGRTVSHGQPRDSSVWCPAISAPAVNKSTVLFSAWSFSPLLSNEFRPVQTNPNQARQIKERVKASQY